MTRDSVCSTFRRQCLPRFKLQEAGALTQRTLVTFLFWTEAAMHRDLAGMRLHWEHVVLENPMRLCPFREGRYVTHGVRQVGWGMLIMVNVTLGCISEDPEKSHIGKVEAELSNAALLHAG